MRKLIRKIYNKIVSYFNTDSLENEVAYINDTSNIIVYLDKNEDLIKIYVNDVLYMIPIIKDLQLLSDVDENFGELISKLEVSNLKQMLTKYEEDQDFDKCVQIRDELKRREDNE